MPQTLPDVFYMPCDYATRAADAIIRRLPRQFDTFMSLIVCRRRRVTMFYADYFDYLLRFDAAMPCHA